MKQDLQKGGFQSDKLVSIIIPCYKQGKYLNECIESIKLQSYKNWEAVIIDDGSPDETEIIYKNLAKENENIKYIRKKNGGLSSARNVGLQFAKGEYIQFLDADDLLESDKIKYQTNILSKNPDIDLVYGNAKYFEDTIEKNTFRLNLSCNEKNNNWIEGIASSNDSTLNKLINGNIFPVCSPIFRKEVFTRVGVFNECLSSHEDWELWVRMALVNVRFYYSRMNNTDALIRVHSSSLSQNKKNMLDTIIKNRIIFSKIIPGQEKIARQINLSKLLFGHQNLQSINLYNYLGLLVTAKSIIELKMHLKYLKRRMWQLSF